MSLGQRLYDLRKTTGLSQEKAAEQLAAYRGILKIRKS